MALYICEADQPYSHIELVLTEHRDGTYDASMDIVRNDEHGEPISISLLTSKDGIKHLLPQGKYQHYTGRYVNWGGKRQRISSWIS